MSSIANVSKIPYIVSATIIGVAAVFLIIIGMLAFAPVNVVKARTQPYKVITKTLEAGDNVIYVADVCKYKEISSIATRIFVDDKGVRYPVPSIGSNVPAGCAENKVTVPTLPNYHSGTWYITLDIEYQINLFRKQSYHFRTETFTITNSIIKPTQ